MQHDNGNGNFNATDDGSPSGHGVYNSGYDFAQTLVFACNYQMDQNPALNLAPGSSLTPVPKRIRWVLDDVYFDRDSEFRNSAGNGGIGANASPARDFDSRCVRADSVINIFLVEEKSWPYDERGRRVVSSPLANRGYVYSTSQAICGTTPTPARMWTAVGSPWTNYVLFGKTAWDIASTVNHELCHLLGLNHPHHCSLYTWGECPDAPMNANCWNLNSPPDRIAALPVRFPTTSWITTRTRAPWPPVRLISCRRT